MHFDWDARKAKQNQAKHGVRFEEALSVFSDPLATVFPDPDHSEAEKRYIQIGTSVAGRLLIVIFTDRGSTVRIVSARKAVRYEREAYEERGP
ncbi:MAG: BrnT family toxin [Armatimonadetes bacterium]|nr:BrnT family toxin [Armatimonadota bacterium]